MTTPSQSLPYSSLPMGGVFVDPDFSFYQMKSEDADGNKVGVSLGPVAGGLGGGSQTNYTEYQNKPVLYYPSAGLTL